MEFNVRNLLTAVLLMVTISGCAKSGGGDSGNSAASVVQGSYESDFVTTTGDAYILTLDIAGGSVEMRTYWFKNGVLAGGEFQKNIGTYVASGDNYTVAYSYKTCNPKASDVYTFSTIDADSLSVEVNGKLFMFKKITGVDKFLSDAGMIMGVEDTACNVMPH